MIRNSIYNVTYHRNDDLLHQGYDYQTPGNLISRVISNQMFGANPVLDKFLTYIESYMSEQIESVKQIKIFANPALDKNQMTIN